MSHLPLVALLVPLWAGEIGAYAVLGRAQLLTVPAMRPRLGHPVSRPSDTTDPRTSGPDDP